jgi:hypothetical protein
MSNLECGICSSQSTALISGQMCENEVISLGVCTDCYRQYVKIEVNEGRVDENGSLRCMCATKKCCNLIGKDLVSSLLSDDQDLLGKHLRFTHNAIVKADASKIWCPGTNCGGIAKVLHSRRASCEKCHLNFCASCSQDHSIFLRCSTVSSCPCNYFFVTCRFIGRR